MVIKKLQTFLLMLTFIINPLIKFMALTEGCMGPNKCVSFKRGIEIINKWLANIRQCITMQHALVISLAGSFVFK